MAAAVAPAPAMAAQAGNDDVVFGGETLDHRIEHLAGDHQPVHKQQGWV
jgi:hypothetical protein